MFKLFKILSLSRKETEIVFIWKLKRKQIDVFKYSQEYAELKRQKAPKTFKLIPEGM